MGLPPRLSQSCSWRGTLQGRCPAAVPPTASKWPDSQARSPHPSTPPTPLHFLLVDRGWWYFWWAVPWRPTEAWWFGWCSQGLWSTLRCTVQWSGWFYCNRGSACNPAHTSSWHSAECWLPTICQRWDQSSVPSAQQAPRLHLGLTYRSSSLSACIKICRSGFGSAVVWKGIFCRIGAARHWHCSELGLFGGASLFLFGWGPRRCWLFGLKSQWWSARSCLISSQLFWEDWSCDFWSPRCCLAWKLVALGCWECLLSFWSKKSSACPAVCRRFYGCCCCGHRRLSFRWSTDLGWWQTSPRSE